jgi:hypothetical protein
VSGCKITPGRLLLSVSLCENPKGGLLVVVM